ncbi:hypothetical protein FACS1894176_10600 [Bacteroidia bacterium]|nr:hypothetical protein FACS1894176_10600 [Bacteroidia bacterium]
MNYEILTLAPQDTTGYYEINGIHYYTLDAYLRTCEENNLTPLYLSDWDTLIRKNPEVLEEIRSKI